MIDQHALVLIIIATLAQMLALNANAQTPIEDTQAKISDAAQSAAATASKLATSAQALFTLGVKESKAESILVFNKHLNGYDIDVSIQDSTATLTGTVSQSIERDLAEQLTLSVTGIHKVINRIRILPNTQKNTLVGTTQQLTSTLKDASITTSIKAQLLANSNVRGMDIHVKTQRKKSDSTRPYKLNHTERFNRTNREKYARSSKSIQPD